MVLELPMPPRSLDFLDTRLRPLCDAILTEACVPGASIAVLAGGMGYHHAYGVKSINTNEPVGAATGFNIGSCSKAFVSATIASLVADGLVNWDDPISTWVPEFKLYDPEITTRVTLRDLSANRIGLSRTGLTEVGLDPSFPAEHIFERLQYTPPAFPFRDRFGYVNAGHTANAVAAGRISGKGFLATLRERILTPLGMTTTSGGSATPSELSDLAGWHVVADGAAVAIDPVFTDQYLASGGMVVSGQDALQWLRFHLGRGLVGGTQVVARDALAECYRPHSVATPGKDILSLFYPEAHMAAYALGWAVSDLEGHHLVAHSGSDIGVTSMTLLLPQSDIGVAVYCNSNGGDPSSLPLAYAIAAMLLGLPPRDWVAYFQGFMPAPLATPTEPVEAAPVPSDLSIYEGSYNHPADGPLEIWREGDGLVGRLRDGYRMTFKLTHSGEHRFTAAFTQTEWAAMAKSSIDLAFTIKDGRAVQVQLPGLFEGRDFHR
jgi:CubicO group peptidase (beta-lactamase class C family)